MVGKLPTNGFEKVGCIGTGNGFEEIGRIDPDKSASGYERDRFTWTMNAPCADVMQRTRDHTSFPRLADYSLKWISAAKCSQ